MANVEASPLARPAQPSQVGAGGKEPFLQRPEPGWMLKGHGGGWRLARSLREITLLEVYEALGRPTLFAFGNRTRHPECLVERGVKAVMETTMTDATALFVRRFGEITLDQIVPDARVSLAVHNAVGEAKASA